jgi:hypothetical protein
MMASLAKNRAARDAHRDCAEGTQLEWGTHDHSSIPERMVER